MLNFYDQQSESEKVEDVSKSLENDLNEAASEVIYKTGSKISKERKQGPRE